MTRVINHRSQNMEKLPKISVIIPAYQNSKELPKCFESIFVQTLKPFEIIVVNDGSTDNTAEVLARYKDRIKIINQENNGANAARNRGFDESSGDFVIFCDADIIMRPDCLEKMFQALQENKNASYAYSSFKFGFKIFKLWPFDGDKLKQMPYIHTSSLVRREHFPRFDEAIRRLQDWDLWLTMLEKSHQGVWIPEVLFYVEPRKAGMSEWIPSFLYKIPWPILGFTPKAIKKYRSTEEIIKKKHKLAQ